MISIVYKAFMDNNSDIKFDAYNEELFNSKVLGDQRNHYFVISNTDNVVFIYMFHKKSDDFRYVGTMVQSYVYEFNFLEKYPKEYVDDFHLREKYRFFVEDNKHMQLSKRIFVMHYIGSVENSRVKGVIRNKFNVKYFFYDRPAYKNALYVQSEDFVHLEFDQYIEHCKECLITALLHDKLKSDKSDTRSYIHAL